MPTRQTLLIAAFVLAAGLLVLRGTDFAFGGEAMNLSVPDPAPGVAVVELFTSEGCSSCPAADDVLAGIVKTARQRGLAVYPLAFHVDYWNSLGWADRFSDAAYSQRQRDYAAALHSDEVYTPQMIVNGAKAFVGSESATARAAIEAALGEKAIATVALNVTSDAQHVRQASYTVTGARAGDVLNVAVVERGLASQVSRGENGGRRLAHENVVRVFKSIKLDAQAKGVVALGDLAGIDAANASVIAYVQRDDRRVIGASQFDLK